LEELRDVACGDWTSRRKTAKRPARTRMEMTP
jgi:hypothetical protein